MIGSILARQRISTGKFLTKGHLVESEVVEGPFTRCGRAMAPREGTRFAPIPGNRCEICFPNQRI